MFFSIIIIFFLNLIYLFLWVNIPINENNYLILLSYLLKVDIPIDEPTRIRVSRCWELLFNKSLSNSIDPSWKRTTIVEPPNAKYLLMTFIKK